MSEKEKLEKEIHQLMNKQYERGLSPVERLKLEELQHEWYQFHDPDRHSPSQPM